MMHHDTSFTDMAYLPVWIGESLFAIPAERLLAIHQPGDVLAEPNSANSGEQPTRISILDLRCLLFPDQAAAQRASLIVINTANGIVGLAVDAVAPLCRTTAADQRHVSPIVYSRPAVCPSVIVDRTELIPVVDIKRLVEILERATSTS